MRLVLALLALTVSQTAFGWAFTGDFQNGFYWRQLPVSFTVTDANSQSLQTLNSLVQGAVADWENNIGEDLWKVNASSSGSGSTNIIRWSKNFTQETGLNSSTYLAVTVRYTNGPYMTKSEIILNGNNFSLSDTQNLRTVIVHELGHTLGLDHSEHMDAVMYASLIPNYVSLHYDDREGMANLVDETLRRQAIGYVSPLAYEKQESESPLSCGTVDMGSGGGSSGGQGPLSLVMGFMLISLLGFSRKVFSLLASFR